MVWVSLCRVYLAVSLALNDRSPTGRFAFVSSFLDHRHLVTGVTGVRASITRMTPLSLSLSLLRAKWKGKEEFEDGCYFNERDPRVERRIVSLRIESFRIEKFVIGLWVLKKYLSTSDSEWIFIRSRDDRYCAERFIIPEEIKIASTKKKNLKNLEKILIQTRISIHTTFLDTRVME